MATNLKKEVARDLLALGGIPFTLIVLVRMYIGEEFSMLVPRIIIGLLALYIRVPFAKPQLHIARCFLLFIYTSIGYEELPYALFAAMLWCGMVFSAAYLKHEKKAIVMGVITGVVSSLIGYHIAGIFYG